jgi:hypothetical protein
MKETDKAWLAGFIDGEGHIGMQRGSIHGKKYYGVRIQITQTNREVLEHVCAITGVNRIKSAHRASENQAEAWGWSCDTADTVSILGEIIPYLVRKKEVAILAVEFAEFWKQNKPPKKPRGMHQEAPDYSSFEEYKERFHKLNARGKGAA